MAPGGGPDPASPRAKGWFMLQNAALAALLGHPVFGDVAQEALAPLAPRLRLVSQPADAVLWRPGEPAAELLFILGGDALRFAEAPGGASARGVLPEGDVGGVEAVFGQTARAEGLIGRAGLRAVAVGAAALLAWVAAQPAEGLRVVLRLGELMHNQAAGAAPASPDPLEPLIGSGVPVQILTTGAPQPLLCHLEALVRGPDGQPMLSVRCHPESFPRPVPGLIPWSSVARIVWEG